MIKKILALTIAISIIFVVLPVFAGSISVSTLVDVDKKQIQVSGDAVGNTLITVVALDVPKIDAEIVFDNSDEESTGKVDELVALKQIYADGEYELIIGMPADAPNCKYEVYVTAGGQKVSDDFVYYDGSAADDKVGLIIKAKKDGDKTKFKSLITSNPLLLGIDETLPSYIKNSDKIFDMLYVSDFNDRKSFVKNYNLFSALCDISDSGKNQVLDVISQHKLTLNLETTSISGDERLNEDILSELCTLIVNEDYAGIILKEGTVDFPEIVNKNKALATIRLADNWGKIKNCIETDFADVFSALLQNEYYVNTNDKNEIFKEMIGSAFATIENVVEIFISASEKVYYAERTNQNNNSQSGGHGGSGGGGMAVTPVMPPVDTVDQNTDEVLFSDLAKEHWSYEAVAVLETKGIISGYPDKTYKPNDLVTRAEFTKMIMTYKDDAVTEDAAEVTFSDVSAKDWFYSYVMKAAKLEIIKGADGLFNPSMQIKREDAALIIYRMLIADGKILLGNKFFADRGQISEYAQSAVAALGNSKIVNGDSEGNFAPQSPLTRAEAAQIIYNAFEK